MNRSKSLRFAKDRQDFFVTLNKRVNDYFKSNNISRHANIEMIAKTVFMFALYFVPFVLMLTGVVSGTWPMIAMCVLMGAGTAGIGLSIMHDANHGAYSGKPWVNNLIGYSLNVVGGNAFNWKIQHNVLHHTYTNVYDADEDISPRGVLRMSPYSEWKTMHRFQHVYAWFIYGLMTFVWVLFKDVIRLISYHKDGLIKKQNANVTQEIVILVVTKLIYLGYIFTLPMVILDLSFWTVFAGFCIMHYVAGFILAVIFQPAHVIEGTEYFEPDREGNLENNWAIHQLHTTTNFANKSKLFSWYVGGLNFQVEHHLFPNICHVHYRKIAPIVESTAKEFGVPYKSAETFLDALVGHGRLLRELGKKPAEGTVAVANAA
ncbi:MAG TPA: acyl-CoA desaturase [Cyclobacteriaceae bacterium]|nr:acyl-CoA desaturase [Cyclobacteriaceae bacterium]HMV08007.1 acyl-CoA desaturase [Cyclobacteriaceae bacterium]HMX00647.1 acyl-CoA desaturase [Cyclobacteriaceae bacterium]HMX49478.1 acyl-CoA desaturase [Cyclobacteriaceae bacterium]HMY93450.1 acyl-CoA desaturase [Cyclobacteriaceae bacterium]